MKSIYIWCALGLSAVVALALAVFLFSPSDPTEYAVSNTPTQQSHVRLPDYDPVHSVGLSSCLAKYIQLVQGTSVGITEEVRHLSRRTGRGVVCARIRVNDCFSLTYNKDSCIVYNYTLSQASELAAKKAPDVLTERSVFSLIQPLLRHYELSTNFSDFSIEYLPLAQVDGENAYHWLIRNELDIDGIPCRHSGIRVDLDWRNGHIVTCTFQPAVRPANRPAHRISRKEAFESFVKWRESSPTWSQLRVAMETDSIEQMEFVVAFPYQSFVSENAELRFLDSPGMTFYDESFYAWELKVRVIHHIHKDVPVYDHITYWIDAEDGTVMGGILARE